MGMVLVGGAVVAAASAAARTANEYEQNRRRKREAIRQSGVEESIGDFRRDVLEEMRDQTRLNTELSNRMTGELEQSRENMLKTLSDGDPGKYFDYLKQIQSSRVEMNCGMMEMQEEFAKNYHTRISSSIEKIDRKMSECHSSNISELRSMAESDAQAREFAGKLAERYLKEAETLINSLRDDFNGEVFSGPRLASLVSQFNGAVSQFDGMRYEASIAVAKSVSLSAIEEIYSADCKKQEWENYHKLVLVQANEIKSYLEAQSVITPEMKRELETRAGRELENEIIGVRIGEYTDVMDNGETQYDYLLKSAAELCQSMESATPERVSVGQLKNTLADINSNLYPSAMTAIYKGILNMSNAFTRQRLSEEIVDFFEEHDFTFTGYSYEDDCHSKALYIGLENSVTGEELVITLAPDVAVSGDIRTLVGIDALGGDEANEDRKEYYRQAVREVVAENTPGARLNLECDKSTRNKLSPKTELKDRIK
jgi:hypothetical protein